MTRHIPVILTHDDIISKAPAAGAYEPIEGVSSRYSFVPTLTAVELLQESGWHPIAAEQSSVRKPERDGFQKHIIRFSKEGLALSSNERVDLVLYNSHDRGCAFRLIASVWRQVCSNGLMVTSEFANFSHRHIGFDPEEFVLSAEKIAGSAGKIAERVGEIRKIELTEAEKNIFAQSAHGLVYDDEIHVPITFSQLLEERRYDDRGNNLWNIFNVIQENFCKGGLRGTTVNAVGKRRRVTTRPIKSIDRNIKLNQALWQLTERMAELKQGREFSAKLRNS